MYDLEYSSARNGMFSYNASATSSMRAIFKKGLLSLAVSRDNIQSQAYFTYHIEGPRR